MKRGLKTTEFWWGFVLSVGIWWLIYMGLYPAHGSAAADGVEWLVALWFAYTGYRGYVKGPKYENNGTSNGTHSP